MNRDMAIAWSWFVTRFDFYSKHTTAFKTIRWFVFGQRPWEYWPELPF